MPLRTVPGTELTYGLLCFNADATEPRDDRDGRDGLLSATLLEMAAEPGITNIFFCSHGWMGDLPAAIAQYDAWFAALMSREADLKRAGEVFPGFRPLLIGLHWPSLPWGDEEIGDGSYADGVMDPVELRGVWEARLGDAPEIRRALGIIFDEAMRNSVPDQMSGEVKQAYLDLNAALGVEADSTDTDGLPFEPGAALGADDPDGFQPDYGSGAGAVFSGLLGGLRLLSYWTMKKRARTIGEQGMHEFVKALQRVTAERGTRIHLMGHSFGTVVISSILGGPGCGGQLVRPVDSVFLAQGAVSLWSYAESIPYGPGGSGYFYRVLTDGKVRGPLVTTQSQYDLAVGKQYPKACLPGEVSFGEGAPPKYGAVGAYGFQGLSGAFQGAPDAKLLAADGEYGFERGKVYNLDADAYICHGKPPSGAHSDIAGPEVAHAIWEAAFASV